MSGTMAITMAGAGSRFTKAGYVRPKYEIEALGIPLFDWSMLSLAAFRDMGWRFSFVVRSGVEAESFIRSRCAVIGLDVSEIIEIDHQTDGQATTALLLSQNAPLAEPFAVYNIDTFVKPGAMVPPQATECAGWIPCFPAPGDGWSFARIGEDGSVLELREKTRISDHATIGLYWFDTAQTYNDLYQKHFARADGQEKGEKYIASMYNRLIDQSRRVQIVDLSLDSVGMLGTPDQVTAFINNPPSAATSLLSDMEKRA